MSNTFLISDTHFGHGNSLNFKRNDGTPLRPFETVEEMDETIVERWNAVVHSNDRVYLLGDIAIKRAGLQTLSRLKGRMVLVKGNHDIWKLSDFLPYFDDIRGSHKLDNFILSHIPIHPESLARWTSGNIHGHLHSNYVMRDDGEWDTRYFNVSVESPHRKLINVQEFAPIPFELIRKYYADQSGQ